MGREFTKIRSSVSKAPAKRERRVPANRYRQFFENAQEGMLILDAGSGEITDINPFLTKILKQSRRNLVAKKPWETEELKDLIPSRSAFRKLESIGEKSRWEVCIHTRRGQPIPVEVTSHAFTVDQERVVQFNLQEIPDRISKEEELLRLNGILRALHNSHQARLRAPDEKTYMDAVCQIVVEDCRHAMVWIGLAEQDAKKTVRPVAWAGFDEGYLKGLDITWAKTERGSGPTGTAIRTGKVRRCANMLTDPKFEPWREEALRRGYASSVSFPLSSGDKPFGAITLYSRTAGAFREDEIRLLSHLASDLAYGIRSYRLQVEQALTEGALAKSESRYRALIENAPIGIGMVDPGGQLVTANPALLQILGYRTLEEIQQIELPSILDPRQRAQIRRSLQRAPGTTSLEIQLERRDGASIPISITLARFHGETGEALLAIIEDISEREHYEEVRSWLASFPEMNPSPVVEVDLSGRVHYSNPTAKQLFPDLAKAGLCHPWLENMHAIFDEFNLDDKETLLRDVHIGERVYQQGIYRVPETDRVRIYGFDITKRVRSEEELKAAHDQLEMRIQERTQQLNQINEQLRQEIADRQHLAYNLHDAVNQSLFSAALIAEVLPRLWERDQETARQSLEDLRRLTRGAQAEMRALLAEIRPSILTEADLDDLLRQLVDAFTGRTNIPVEIQVEGKQTLPPDVQIGFYRLCQEGLNNIVKHAKASRVEMQVSFRADGTQIRLRDNGCGFDPIKRNAAGHIGLSLMHELSQSSGIDLKIISQPGHGTELIFTWKRAVQEEAPQ